ncbi:MAG TPA: hypothetical protein VLG37_00190 [Candidatus Saccharimonadales bacterium]|nr:hypothetical protein [Candidatus Saccharimonadales bacterium]
MTDPAESDMDLNALPLEAPESVSIEEAIVAADAKHAQDLEEVADWEKEVQAAEQCLAEAKAQADISGAEAERLKAIYNEQQRPTSPNVLGIRTLVETTVSLEPAESDGPSEDRPESAVKAVPGSEVRDESGSVTGEDTPIVAEVTYVTVGQIVENMLAGDKYPSLYKQLQRMIDVISVRLGLPQDQRLHLIDWISPAKMTRHENEGRTAAHKLPKSYSDLTAEVFTDDEQAILGLLFDLPQLRSATIQRYLKGQNKVQGARAYEVLKQLGIVDSSEDYKKLLLSALGKLPAHQDS